MMKIEFTKELTGDKWNELKYAREERGENLLLENLPSTKKVIIEAMESNPNYYPLTGHFKLLQEMAAETKKLWKRGSTLPVFFFGNNLELTQKILRIASEWSKYGNIKFVQVSEASHSKIRISFDKPGNYSYIGTDAKGVPTNDETMNFEGLDNSTPEHEFRHLVLHEFGHALGLIHEHQSPAAEIDWDKDYVYQYFLIYFPKWTKEMIDHNIFQEFEARNLRYSDFDDKSIMAYGVPKKFIKNDVVLSQNYNLSEKDKEYIRSLYPF